MSNIEYFVITSDFIKSFDCTTSESFKARKSVFFSILILLAGEISCSVEHEKRSITLRPDQTVGVSLVLFV